MFLMPVSPFASLSMVGLLFYSSEKEIVSEYFFNIIFRCPCPSSWIIHPSSLNWSDRPRVWLQKPNNHLPGPSHLLQQHRLLHLRLQDSSDKIRTPRSCSRGPAQLKAVRPAVLGDPGAILLHRHHDGPVSQHPAGPLSRLLWLQGLPFQVNWGSWSLEEGHHATVHTFSRLDMVSIFETENQPVSEQNMSTAKNVQHWKLQEKFHHIRANNAVHPGQFLLRDFLSWLPLQLVSNIFFEARNQLSNYNPSRISVHWHLPRDNFANGHGNSIY